MTTQTMTEETCCQQLCPIDRIAHTTAFVTPVVEYWLKRKMFLMEENVLFNDARNTFYLQTYGKRPLR